MLPDDQRHGTYAGYNAGCRDGCCRTAAAAYQRARYFDHAVLGLPPRHVDKTGTMRRVQALQRLGWSAEALSRRMGHSRAYLNVTINRDARRGIHRDTAAAVRALYDELSMTLGPSTITRKRAEQKGWLPPLAWDDDRIDDPTYHPTDWQYVSGDRGESIRDMAEMGHGVTEVCRRLHIGREALEKWSARNGMSETFRLLVARETAVFEHRNQHTREAS